MRFPTLICILALTAVPLQAGEVNLLESDWEGALQKASETGRHVYVAFLGTGWSMASKRFDEAHLDTPAFRQLAEERLLYCRVEARKSPKLNKMETARLQALVIHFDIKAYPTFILVAPDGTELLRHGYRDFEEGAYTGTIEAILPPIADPD